MYRIGEFSYLYGVTVKTLRYYDKINLFNPNYTDPYTGYRYYSDEQKEEFSNILKLKKLNFSLEEIKEMKENLQEELIDKKIKELEEEQSNIKNKIEELEKINRGNNKMNYNIGFASNMKLDAVGIKVVVEKKDNKLLEKYFEIVENKLNKIGFNCENKVVITLEVGYKEEDIELFVGYLIKNRDHKIIETLYNNKEKLELELFGFPTSDYLAVMDLQKEENILDACSDIIDYANKNKIQILGPFMEVYNYSNSPISIFTFIKDLKRDEVFEIRKRKKITDKLNEFTDNKCLYGTWKIKEILPNIDFNPDRQKSIPDTKYTYIKFENNGKTNYENITWNDKYLLIKHNDEAIECLITNLNINNKEYLEIRMNDMYEKYKNAKPISYIYEKIN